MDVEALLGELRKPETLTILGCALEPHLKDGVRTLVYPMPYADAIGHLAPEPHYLASLYCAEYDRIVLLTPPRAVPTMKRPLYDLLARDFGMAETQHAPLLLLRDLDRGIVRMGPFDLCLVHTHKFYRAYTQHRAARKPLVHLKLDDEMRSAGERWLAGIGLEPGSPYVTLHMREEGYAHDAGSAPYGKLRTVDPANFRPAVDWLVQAGYTVFRLGGENSEPFIHPSGKVIDLAHDPRAEDFLDIYLMATCSFSRATTSGSAPGRAAYGSGAVPAPGTTLSVVPWLSRVTVNGSVVGLARSPLPCLSSSAYLRTQSGCAGPAGAESPHSHPGGTRVSFPSPH